MSAENPYELPSDWNEAIGIELKKPYFLGLKDFLTAERATNKVFPPEEEVFSAYQLTPFSEVKVLILGQDPYHGKGQAHGLSFSVKPGISVPPSLENIYKELQSDVGVKHPNNGYLVPWAKQGVMMLNAVLTVRARTANSHKDKGWETFTDATIKALSDGPRPVIFVLWGKYAQKKIKLINTTRHTVLQGAHPSPYSADAGFFGSKPFSTINTILSKTGSPPIDWQIPDL